MTFSDLEMWRMRAGIRPQSQPCQAHAQTPDRDSHPLPNVPAEVHSTALPEEPCPFKPPKSHHKTVHLRPMCKDLFAEQRRLGACWSKAWGSRGGQWFKVRLEITFKVFLLLNQGMILRVYWISFSFFLISRAKPDLVTKRDCLREENNALKGVIDDKYLRVERW